MHPASQLTILVTPPNNVCFRIRVLSPVSVISARFGSFWSSHHFTEALLLTCPYLSALLSLHLLEEHPVQVAFTLLQATD